MKIKQWYKDNKEMILMGLGLIVTGMATYLGFKKGVDKMSKKVNKAEINVLKAEAETVIIKEKLADKEKPISEISSDVDNFLSRK